MSIVVDPEMQEILRELQANPSPAAGNLPMVEARKAFEGWQHPWNEPRLPVGGVEDFTIEGAGGPLRLRLYLPAGTARVPVVLYAHGGGWTFGSLESHDGICRNITRESGCAVLAVDYRLAPEHPFPAANDDVAAAIAFVVGGGLPKRVDPKRVGLAGDSAGANLMLSTLISMRDRGDRSVSAGALFYGCYAPRFDTESHRLLGDGSYALSTMSIRKSWANFLGDAKADEAGPLAAPLGAELAGLPPLYLSAAGLDPLLDDTLELCGRLAYAGVPYRFDLFPGVTHGFLRMTSRLKAARTSMRRIGSFFQEAFGLQ